MTKLNWIACLLVSLLLGCGSDSTSDPPATDLGLDGQGSTSDAFVSSLSLDELLEGCVRASACGVKTYPNLANCLGAYQDLYLGQGLGAIYDKIYACVNAAGGDCVAIAACFGRGADCDNTYKAQCSGTTAISCDLIDKRVYQVACADAQLSCGIKSDQAFSASCTLGSCDTSFTNQCDGSRLLSCNSGVIEIHDCAQDGLVCGLGGFPTQNYGCQGESASRCFSWGKNPFQPSCEGQVAVTCVHGREHREDCTKNTYVGTACVDGACVNAGSECSDEMNRCAGTKLEACLDGTWKQFDCEALGLGACKASGTYGANCS